jgi:hypothetical protein
MRDQLYLNSVRSVIYGIFLKLITCNINKNLNFFELLF